MSNEWKATQFLLRESELRSIYVSLWTSALSNLAHVQCTRTFGGFAKCEADSFFYATRSTFTTDVTQTDRQLNGHVWIDLCCGQCWSRICMGRWGCLLNVANVQYFQRFHQIWRVDVFTTCSEETVNNVHHTDPDRWTKIFIPQQMISQSFEPSFLEKIWSKKENFI